MADKLIDLQLQVRQNSDELQGFLQDLNRWEIQAKRKDEELKKERAIYKKDLPPVRNSKCKGSKKDKKSQKVLQPVENGSKKKARISSYDYDAWSKFDVEGACQKVDDSHRNSPSSSEEEEDEEKLEAAQMEHCRLKANLEKEKGNNLFKDGKMEAAIEHYTKGIILDPQNAVLPANRAMALLRLEKFAAAEEDCSSSLALDPTYVKAYARRAVARQRLKKYQGAFKDYEEILKLEPNHKQAIVERDKLAKILENAKEGANIEEKPIKSRSNKPFRRIQIREVGSTHSSSVKSGEQNQATLSSPTQPKQIEKPADEGLTGTGHPPAHTTQLTLARIPISSVEFDTDFKTLKDRPEDLYMYIKAIPPISYPKLLAQTVEEALGKFIAAFRTCYIRDDLPYLDGLEFLSKVPRFDVARMFLSSGDKQALSFLFQHQVQKNREKQDDQSQARTLELAKKYSIAL